MKLLKFPPSSDGQVSTAPCVVLTLNHLDGLCNTGALLQYVENCENRLASTLASISDHITSGCRADVHTTGPLYCTFTLLFPPFCPLLKLNKLQRRLVVNGLYNHCGYSSAPSSAYSLSAAERKAAFVWSY